jgi:UDPglucose 6-dehydrogenase
MREIRVGVIGAGYVGLTSAVCLAHKGFDTVCVDTDAHRVDQLLRGIAVIEEPQLDVMLRSGLDRGTLRFVGDHRALSDRDVVFICVPTPTGTDGRADTSSVESCIDTLADVLVGGSVVAIKSTVPVGTCRRMSQRLVDRQLTVVSNPEFLREGHTIYDFTHPDRVVIGVPDDEKGERAAGLVAQLYADDTDNILRMTLESAELSKYASNAFLAVKLSYVNSLAALCTQVGADIDDVAGCMAADARIGSQFLKPGPGWGGSCLPKDTAALLHTGQAYGVALREVESARTTNADQAARIIATLRKKLERPLSETRIAVLGLTFKAGTSDIRDSPALAICAELAGAGAQLTTYDPRLESIDTASLSLSTASDPYVAVKDADAIVVLTEWPEFTELDWTAIGRNAATGAVVVDSRNILDGKVNGTPLHYLGNGRVGGY